MPEHLKVFAGTAQKDRKAIYKYQQSKPVGLCISRMKIGLKRVRALLAISLCSPLKPTVQAKIFHSIVSQSFL